MIFCMDGVEDCSYLLALRTFQFDPNKKEAGNDLANNLITVNAVFTGLYTLEFLLKLCAFGKVWLPISQPSSQLVGRLSWYLDGWLAYYSFVIIWLCSHALFVSFLLLFCFGWCLLPSWPPLPSCYVCLTITDVVTFTLVIEMRLSLTMMWLLETWRCLIPFVASCCL